MPKKKVDMYSDATNVLQFNVSDIPPRTAEKFQYCSSLLPLPPRFLAFFFLIHVLAIFFFQSN
jgi:hypothetical protein